MWWCAPTTQRWSLISTTREVCVRAPCTSWHTRSLCGPRANSSRWGLFIFLGISIWEQTSCRGRGRGPGNGCFTPRWWSRYGEFLARLKWTSLRLKTHCNVPSGSLWFLQLLWETWPRLRLYAFHLIALLPGVLERVRGPSAISSPILAGPSMVLGSDFSPRRLFRGDSRQEGPPLTGGGHYCPPSPGALEAVGVAPKGAQLIASGLSTEVVETILQSRAPSKRKLYDLKWKLFTSWCGDRQLDPVNCPVGTVQGPYSWKILVLRVALSNTILRKFSEMWVFPL